MTDADQTVEGPDGAPVASKDDKVWGLIAHLGGLATSFIVPLVVWLAKKDDSAFIEDQGKEALNFQLTVLMASLVSSIFVCVGGLGVFLMLAVGLADLILCIVAAVKAYDGHRYRYPFTLRLVN